MSDTWVETVIYKDGDDTNVQNYKSFSLQPTLSKIVEKVVKERILDFITNFVDWDPYQYNFIENSVY